MKIIELPDYATTSQMAANAIGCNVTQIAKSIIFRIQSSDKPLLVIASGSNRVNEQLIVHEVQDELLKANASFVREQTGFDIGGVSPTGHIQPILTIIDEDFFQY